MTIFNKRTWRHTLDRKRTAVDSPLRSGRYNARSTASAADMVRQPRASDPRSPAYDQVMELCLRSKSGPIAPQNDSLRSLVAELSTGDEAALAAIYDATSRRVYGLAMRIVRDRAAAEEVVHEVYAQVWRQADRY